jgi:hypothetical protein
MTIEISSASGFEITKIFVSVTMVTSAAMHFLFKFERKEKYNKKYVCVPRFIFQSSV